MHDHLSIAVTDATSRLHLGVGEDERAAPQEVLISVRLDILDPDRFPDHDQLARTIDYDCLIGFLRADLPELGPFRLIETVADVVAGHALGLSHRITAAEVTVKKPSVLGALGMVAVTLKRFAPTHRLRAGLAAIEEARA